MGENAQGSGPETVKKEAKLEKKEARRAKKERKKEAFRALSARGKAVYLAKHLIPVFLAVVLLLGGAYMLYQHYAQEIGQAIVDHLLKQEVSEEQLLAEAPVNQALSEKIDSAAPYSEDDTWAIYVYMCGSNLEGGTMNNLSEFSQVLLSSYSKELKAEKNAGRIESLQTYMEEITEQGMDVPDYMYLNTPMNWSASDDEGETEPEIWGYASSDLKEMLEGVLSDKIRIIVQTGGSAAWKNPQINPNRSQRFIIDTDGMRLLEDNHFVNMGDPESLSDFFRFCEEAAPADHKMVIFWNHGGGAFGYASDDLYGGDSLTMTELREAFAAVYDADPENPAFELIGFDACLMASMETTEALHGFGRYLAASEEIEPGYGWDHTVWLQELSERPSLNGAQVGKSIADSYIDFYARRNIQLEQLGASSEVTFSILDINESHKVYEQFCDLADIMLKDSIDDIGTLVTMGRAANDTVRFADSSYDIFNMIDFSNLIENLQEAYPEETAAIMETLQQAVVYNRSTKAMNGAGGIAVYFPTSVPNADSLVYFLDYLENICANDSIRALYYYKVSGCLNEELQSYASSLGYGRAEQLDNTPLRNLQYENLEIDGTQAAMLLPEVPSSLIQNVTFYLGKFQEDSIVNYGEDALVKIEDGRLVSTFDGSWICMDGHALPLEKLDNADGVSRYRTKVEYNGTDSYMMLAVDEENSKADILGIYDMEDGLDTVVMANRNIKHVQVGDKLRIIYNEDGLDVGAQTKHYGPKFTYQADTKITYQSVENGSYMAVFVMYDMRGDAFYSPIVQYEIQGGKIVSAEHRDDFVVSTTE